MKMYYYHTRPIQEALDEWKNHLHPGHILYGLTHFSKHGIHPVSYTHLDVYKRQGYLILPNSRRCNSLLRKSFRRIKRRMASINVGNPFIGSSIRAAPNTIIRLSGRDNACRHSTLLSIRKLLSESVFGITVTCLLYTSRCV